MRGPNKYRNGLLIRLANKSPIGPNFRRNLGNYEVLELQREEGLSVGKKYDMHFPVLRYVLNVLKRTGWEKD